MLEGGRGCVGKGKQGHARVEVEDDASEGVKVSVRDSGSRSVSPSVIVTLNHRSLRTLKERSSSMSPLLSSSAKASCPQDWGGGERVGVCYESVCVCVC